MEDRPPIPASEFFGETVDDPAAKPASQADEFSRLAAESLISPSPPPPAPMAPPPSAKCSPLDTPLPPPPAIPDPAPSRAPKSGHFVDFDDLLAPVLGAIHDLQVGIAEYENVEHSLVGMRQAVQQEREARQDMDGRLKSLRDEIAELHDQTTTTRDATMASAKTVRELIDKLAHDQRTGSTPADPRDETNTGSLMPLTVAVVIGVLMSGWSVISYLRTGEIYYALTGFVIVNLVGFLAIVLGRRRVD